MARKKYSENEEAKKIKELIKGHDYKKNEDEIYRLLKKHIKIIEFDRKKKIAWGIIEGIIITEKERKIIDSIFRRKGGYYEK